MGTMGIQISSLCILLGHDVNGWSRSIGAQHEELVTRGVKLLKRKVESGFELGKFSPFNASLATLPHVITIECLREDLGIQRCVLEQLSPEIFDIGLLTYSSSYGASEIQPKAQPPHFFNPVYSVKLVEGPTSNSIMQGSLSELFYRLQGLGFTVIETCGNRGLVGNYLLFNEISAALKLVDIHYYNCSTIDIVTAELGRSTSLFDLIDLIGVEVTLAILQNLKEHDDAIYLSPVFHKAIAQSILGRKNKTSIRSVLSDSLSS